MKCSRQIKWGLGLCFLAIIAMACQKTKSHYVKIEPATLSHVENSDLMRLTLTEKATKRLGIKTAPVQEQQIDEAGLSAETSITVPYGALIYDPHGDVWVYTNPESGVFIRHKIAVRFIRDDLAFLNDGPPVGTPVVAVGAAELYGTEYEVGH